MNILNNRLNLTIPDKRVLILFRTRLLAFISLGTTLFFTFMNASWGYFYSVILLSAISIALIIGITLSYIGRREYFKFIVLVTINLSLVGLSFAEGTETWVHVYYFPLLICVPYIIEEEKKYRNELLAYSTFTVLCALIAHFIAPEVSKFQSMDPHHVELLRNLDFLGALLLGIIFLSVIISSEQIYKSGLIRDKLSADKKAQFRKQFLAGTSHELRTSLNGIHAAVNLLKNREQLDGQSEYFDIIEYCSSSMLDIINEILDFEKVDAGQTVLNNSSSDIYHVLSDSITPYKTRASARGIELTARIDGSIKNKTVMADNSRITQILHNLLSNALKYTEKGSIELTVTNLKETADFMFIKITVTDTGIGIESENLENIFIEFWQENKRNEYVNRGTGLGLSITHKLLALMQSKLYVVSTPGRGSSFSFSLNLEKTEAPIEAAQNIKPGIESLKGIAVLLADDDPINLTVTKRVLEYYGAVVVTAQNGKEAFEKICEQFFSIALMDLEMPVMNGYEAISLIRTQNSAIPVIAFTATITDEATRFALQQCGFTSFISKPFTPELLTSCIAKYSK